VFAGGWGMTVGGWGDESTGTLDSAIDSAL
jgi:hypothetical protein